MSLNSFSVILAPESQPCQVGRPLLSPLSPLVSPPSCLVPPLPRDAMSFVWELDALCLKLVDCPTR